MNYIDSFMIRSEALRPNQESLFTSYIIGFNTSCNLISVVLFQDGIWPFERTWER